MSEVDPYEHMQYWMFHQHQPQLAECALNVILDYFTRKNKTLNNKKLNLLVDGKKT